MENEQPIVAPEKTQAEIDKEVADLLGQYTEKAAIEKEVKSVEQNQPAQSAQPIQQPLQNQPVQQPQNNSTAPYGYYQSGKKIGQPRPKPKNAPYVAPVQQPLQNNTNLDLDFLDGELLIMVTDFVIPMAMTAANNYFTEDKIRMKDMCLSTDVEKKLARIADKALQRLKISANPVVILFLVLIAAYGTNFMAAKMKGKFGL